MCTQMYGPWKLSEYNNVYYRNTRKICFEFVLFLYPIMKII